METLTDEFGNFVFEKLPYGSNYMVKVEQEEPKGEVDADSSVSMNYWGFHPSIFESIEKGLISFIKDNLNSPTAEYYIPDIITDMIMAKKMDVKVIPTNDNWFGVTYKEDKQMAVDAINEHIKNNVYPGKLWIN